jgi:hypothetical protein
MSEAQKQGQTQQTQTQAMVSSVAPSSLHVFSCDTLSVTGVKPARAPMKSVAGTKPLSNTVAIDKAWLKTLWQEGGDAAVMQLGETLCRRQNPPRRGAMEPIVGPDDLKAGE